MKNYTKQIKDMITEAGNQFVKDANRIKGYFEKFCLEQKISFKSTEISKKATFQKDFMSFYTLEFTMCLDKIQGLKHDNLDVVISLYADGKISIWPKMGDFHSIEFLLVNKKGIKVLIEKKFITVINAWKKEYPEQISCPWKKRSKK